MSASPPVRVDRILLGDNLDAAARRAGRLRADGLPDPPFNTGRDADAPHARARSPTDGGDRTGFGGRRYATHAARGVLLPRRVRRLPRLPRAAPARGAPRCSHPTGTLYLHLDYREAHYCKLLLDELFGRECFLNELIWAYDYGAKPRRRWPQKHDTILVYVKDRGALLLRRRGGRPRALHGARASSRPRRRARGKRPIDVMWHTIVSPTGREKTGYPTQKPEGLVRRFVQASLAPRRPRAWTRSPARARSARSRPSSAAATC